MRATIVIPLSGKLDLTKACVAALRAATPGLADEIGDVEVVLVDNASPDGTGSWLEHEVVGTAGFVVQCNEVNAGFAAASNQGVRAGSGEFVVFLNNDTEVTAGWLEGLLGRLADPVVGVAGARLVYPNRTVQHAGVSFGVDRIGAHDLVGAAEDDRAVLRARAMQAVTAACMAMRRSDFEAVGGFDEGYVNGAEDIDLCLQVRELGLEVWYEPACLVVHHESQSSGRFQWAHVNIQRFLSRWSARVVPDRDLVPLPGTTGALPRPAWLPDLPLRATHAFGELGGGGPAKVAGNGVVVAASGRAVGVSGRAWARLGGPEPALIHDLPLAIADLVVRARAAGVAVWQATDVVDAPERESEADVVPAGPQPVRGPKPDAVPTEQFVDLGRQVFVLPDAPPQLDVRPAYDARARQVLLTPDFGALEADPVNAQANLAGLVRATATSLAGIDDVTLVVRAGSDPTAVLAPLEAGIEGIADEHLPDIVLATAGAEADTVLARAAAVVVVDISSRANVSLAWLALHEGIAVARPEDLADVLRATS